MNSVRVWGAGLLTALLLSAAWGLDASLAGIKAGQAPMPATSVADTPFNQTHGGWTDVLRRYVNGGRVDYAGLRAHDEAALNAYLATLRSVGHDQSGGWTRDEKLAFWINAYNAFTVRLILDHYPVKSIRSIGLLPLAAFTEPFISLPLQRSNAFSLNDIEQDILRKEFREPRIHFALVCASKGCPELRPEAFRPADLERQLVEVICDFIRDPSHGRLDPASSTIYLSSIFDWYHQDFEKAAGNVIEFVARHSDGPVATALRKEGIRSEYLTYDWTLNGT